MTEKPPPVTLPSRLRPILEDAERLFGVARQDIIGPRRFRRFVLARAYVAQRAHDELGFSAPYIGKRLGGRDHTTILHLKKPHLRAAVAAALAERRP